MLTSYLIQNWENPWGDYPDTRESLELLVELEVANFPER